MTIEGRVKRTDQVKNMQMMRETGHICRARFVGLSKMFCLLIFFLFQELGLEGAITDLLYLIRNSWALNFKILQIFLKLHT